MVYTRWDKNDVILWIPVKLSLNLEEKQLLEAPSLLSSEKETSNRPVQKKEFWFL